MCAQEAWSQLGLDRVLLVPVGQAPHRTLEDDPGAEMRFELCSRAVEGDERLDVSRVEVDREGPSYTSETLRLLAGEVSHSRRRPCHSFSRCTWPAVLPHRVSLDAAWAGRLCVAFVGTV